MLRANPFAVDAWFDDSCTLTFAVPAEEIAARIPACLRPDVYEEKWGFIAVAVVRTRRLRPAGLPAFLGHDFVLAGYRYFVRFRSRDGRDLRGLYIVRSETDRLRMALLGNLFTRYRYVKTALRVVRGDRETVVSSPDTGLEIAVDPKDDADLPEGSPFPDWRAARRFSGPLPFTFSVDERKRRVLIVEGVRQNWTPRPVRVLRWKVPYLETLGLGHAILANAFIVKDIPYHWKKGRAEEWPEN